MEFSPSLTVLVPLVGKNVQYIACLLRVEDIESVELQCNDAKPCKEYETNYTDEETIEIIFPLPILLVFTLVSPQPQTIIPSVESCKYSRNRPIIYSSKLAKNVTTAIQNITTTTTTTISTTVTTTNCCYYRIIIFLNVNQKSSLLTQNFIKLLCCFQSASNCSGMYGGSRGECPYVCVCVCV